MGRSRLSENGRHNTLFDQTWERRRLGYDLATYSSSFINVSDKSETNHPCSSGYTQGVYILYIYIHLINRVKIAYTFLKKNTKKIHIIEKVYNKLLIMNTFL